MRKKLLITFAYAAIIVIAAAVYLAPSGNASADSQNRNFDNTSAVSFLSEESASASTASSETAPEDASSESSGTASSGAEKSGDETQPGDNTSSEADTTNASQDKNKKKKASTSSEKSDDDSGADQKKTVESEDGRYSVTMFAAESDGMARSNSNVRSGPSSDYPRAGSLRSGETVVLVGEVTELDGTSLSPSWYAVRLEDGTEGFVRSDLLSLAQ